MSKGVPEHRRSAKTARELARRAPTKNAKQTVLVVCEGDKTEPSYLDEMKQNLKLSNADIQIYGRECESAPRQVVRFALTKFRENPIFDTVFCVFDRDTHATYAEACDKIRTTRMPGKTRLVAIRSVPCDLVISDLKKYLPDYEKGRTRIFQQIGHLTNVAIKHAEIAQKAATASGTDNPTTEMHILIRHFQAISTPQPLAAS